VTVQAEELLSPTGRLQPKVLWPGVSPEDVNEKLEAFLTEAAVKVADLEDATDVDTATTAWAYYRAFDEVYLRLVGLPSTVDFRDEGSGSYLVTQMNLMKELRDQALVEFTAILDAAAVVEETSAPVPRSSVSAPISFRF
jgi:hypothetical protein